MGMNGISSSDCCRPFPPVCSFSKLMSASVAFCSFVGKRLGDHLIERAFVDTDILAAWTLNFLSIHLRVIHFLYSVLVTAQNFTRADFVISPELLFTGGAMDGQHKGREGV
jgi:hypothetical protein